MKKNEKKFGDYKINAYLCQKFYTMAEKLKPEEVWYLNKMVELSEKDFAEGRTYTQDEVKEFLKARRHASKVVTARVV